MHHYPLHATYSLFTSYYILRASHIEYIYILGEINLFLSYISSPWFVISFRVRYVFWFCACIYECMCQKISDYLQSLFAVLLENKQRNKTNQVAKTHARKWIKHLAFQKQELTHPRPKIILFLTWMFYFLSANFVDWSSSVILTKYHPLIYWRCCLFLLLQ